MISKDEIREILSQSPVALSADVGDDGEFVMDSFTMVTLQASLDDRYGIRLDPRLEDLQRLNSVNDIHAYLLDRFPEHMAR